MTYLMMINPEDGDGNKTKRKKLQTRDEMEKICDTCDMERSQLDGKKSHHDRKHPIAECFKPGFVHTK